MEIKPSSNDKNNAKTPLPENSNKTNVRESIASEDIISESNRLKNIKSKCSNDNQNQEEILGNRNTDEQASRSRPFSHLVIVSDSRESPPSPEPSIDQLTFQLQPN